MKIIELSPNDLTPYEKNPRINDHAVKLVADSIKQLGFNQPIVVNQDNVICVGHTRWKAAKKLNLKLVPVYKKEMTEAEFIAYNLADNKVGEKAIWDEELLEFNLEKIKELDFAEDWFEELNFDAELSASNLIDEDYSSKNKEINTNEYGNDLEHTCPRCGFEFND